MTPVSVLRTSSVLRKPLAGTPQCEEGVRLKNIDGRVRRRDVELKPGGIYSCGGRQLAPPKQRKGKVVLKAVSSLVKAPCGETNRHDRRPLDDGWRHTRIFDWGGRKQGACHFSFLSRASSIPQRYQTSNSLAFFKTGKTAGLEGLTHMQCFPSRRISGAVVFFRP